jgi:hypothetical protein
MDEREISEWARKLSAAFASGESSVEKVTERLAKSIEDMENGKFTYLQETPPTVTYKKRRKWTK